MQKNNRGNKLSPAEHHILREKGTEPAFSGKYYNHHEKGMYTCASCGANLFSSKYKYDSKTGWPSFDRAEKNQIAHRQDASGGMNRTEVTCKHCGGHLGHVFDDGPQSTGKRYCINSLALNFNKNIQ